MTRWFSWMPRWLVITLALIGGLWIYVHTVFSSAYRYRMTFEVEVGGKVRSASSILQTTFSYGLFSASGEAWFSTTYGIVPFIDLGPAGIVMPTLDFDRGDYARQSQRLGRTVGPFVALSGIPLAAYNVEHWRSLSWFAKPVEMKGDLPSFFWVPADQDVWKAKQVLPEEFPVVMGPGVKFRRVVVEPAPFATLIKKFDPQPPWVAGVLKLGSSYIKNGDHQHTLVSKTQIEGLH